MSIEERLGTLDAQQALLTDSLSRMLQGQWTGFPSLEADLEALAPGIELDPHPPLLESEAGPPPAPSWWAQYDPKTSMPRQMHSWSCSACALAWVLRATQLNPDATEETEIEEIGYPTNINPTYGLMDGSGAQLQRVIGQYGVESQQAWLGYDDVYAIFGRTTGLMSGDAWYHWVGVRGHDGGNLWIANSAPNYMGVNDILTRADFQRLGPFSVVWLVR